PAVAQTHLGFGRTFANSIDAVSDRDFLADGAYACSMALVHLSRLAEEIVLWSSSEFGFVTLPDRYATGSSMMPQKKNPDVAELATGTAEGLVRSGGRFRDAPGQVAGSVRMAGAAKPGSAKDSGDARSARGGPSLKSVRAQIRKLRVVARAARR